MIYNFRNTIVSARLRELLVLFVCTGAIAIGQTAESEPREDVGKELDQLEEIWTKAVESKPEEQADVAKLEALKSELARMQQADNQRRKAMDELFVKQAAVDKENVALKQELVRLQAVAAAIQKENESLKGELRSITGEDNLQSLKQLKDELRQTRTIDAQRRKTMDELFTKLAELEKNSESVNAELAAANEKAAQYQQEIEQLKAEVAASAP